MTARAAVLLVLAGIGLMAVGPAEGVLSCTPTSVNPLDFGTPSPFDATAVDVSSTFAVTCTADKNDIPGTPGATRGVTVCVGYDNGTGGASPGGNRRLAGGSETALFDVYPTSAHGPTHWGSRAGAPPGVVVQRTVTLTRPSGSTVAPQSASVTAFGRLFAGQTTLTPGAYSTALGVTVEGFWADLKSDCGAGGTVNSSASATQLATVTYRRECRVGTIGALDFGSTGFLTSAVDAATSVGVSCTRNTSYRIGLDAGLGSGATTSTRRMTRAGTPASTVTYSLYRDAARSLNWGNDTAGGSDTQNGTGTGGAVGHPIYGRVPPQDTPEAGDFVDTVVLTVAF